MIRKFFLLIILLVSVCGFSQEIQEKNTDSLYFQGLKFYKNQEFKTSLAYTNRGLELAPEYHDIRILRVRNYWALDMIQNATSDLEFLLAEAEDYPGVRELVLRQTKLLKDPETALKFLNKIEETGSLSTNSRILKSQLLLENKQKSESREIALELFNDPDLDEKDRYLLQNILKRTISNEIGINYQYIYFSDSYNREAWQTISPEFQHYFNRTAVIARLNYNDRGYQNGTLYELEAYPVFSDKVYSFLNVGISNGSLYPDLRTSASIFVNFLRKFEFEAGGRLLHFSDQDYFSAIAGLTMYQGKFYLNTRIFMGPEINDQYTQNYQLNVRYYLNNTDNFLMLRLGTGISPDESTIFTQVQENPGLEAYYSNLGINFTIGPRHIIQAGIGYLFEDITSEKEGDQAIGNIGYRFRF
ncbi:YaiO family outer membrane beta-barrel protein [Gramella sp. MT6]|uniref:YaiO family outer membrane beta-barrel protein n=1 Tax=Gramella sp. MT6 TaxID=2705471 RepID=UPI001C5D8064|nr:YaiO family outer membrane beta-barrel protein [Gramella sp. MT6]QYA26978.1 YaiO family outer membrane beta-barrel protein [Gramella sp. MT6]